MTKIVLVGSGPKYSRLCRRLYFNASLVKLCVKIYHEDCSRRKKLFLKIGRDSQVGDDLELMKYTLSFRNIRTLLTEQRFGIHCPRIGLRGEPQRLGRPDLASLGASPRLNALFLRGLRDC